jgi:hypothetical protein
MRHGCNPRVRRSFASEASQLPAVRPNPSPKRGHGRSSILRIEMLESLGGQRGEAVDRLRTRGASSVAAARERLQSLDVPELAGGAHIESPGQAFRDRPVTARRRRSSTTDPEGPKPPGWHRIRPATGFRMAVRRRTPPTTPPVAAPTAVPSGALVPFSRAKSRVDRVSGISTETSVSGKPP